MKRLLLCLALAFAAIAGMQAAPKLPRFSASTDEATWYYITFSSVGNCLSDRGNNIALRAVALNTSSAAFKWALVGDKDSFRLVSGNGRSVVYSDAKGTFVCSTSDAGDFCLVVSEDDDECWEIRPVGSDNALTKANANASSAISSAPGGSALAAVTFEPTEMLPPTFSTDAASTWYLIQFKAGAQTAIADQGSGTAVKQAVAGRTDEQLWRLVGDESGFRIQNKKNSTYLYVSGTSVMSTTNAAQAGIFTLAQTENTTYKPAYMIQSGTAGYFNAWAGITAGNGVGIWSSTTDQNNVVAFIAEADIELDEYTTAGVATYTPEHQSTLWYNVPTAFSNGLSGDTWKDYALPLGNGQLGSTFIGGVYKEDLQFNEKTLWTGRSSDAATYGSYVGGSGYGGYQNFGDIIVKQMDTDAFDFAEGKGVTNYLRQLDLSTATGLVTFTSEATGANYERRYIVSNPDNVAAYLFTADQPGRQTLRITLSSGKPGVDAATTYADGEATFSGKLQTVTYNARVKVVNKGGTLKTRGSAIDVTGADSVIIYVAAGTDYDPTSTTYVSADLRTALPTTMQERVAAAAARPWDALYADHVADHKQFFDRVEFVLDAASNNQPTETLVNNYSSQKGTTAAGALMLEKLYFDYGRYLTIAGSRGIALPTNLQGIWNNSSSAPWGADIHANINVQMNYWPAEPTNLSELHLPLLDYIINMSQSAQWKQNATGLAGQTKGWTCITENNIFGGRGSFQTNYVIANAWYVTHLWQHYRYTLDRAFLRRAFPAMWGATQFWMERLVLASDGTYECPNEYSPEHGPGSQNAVAHAQQLVAELFANTLDAIAVLGDEAGVSADDLATLQDRYAKLDKGLAIETYTGSWGTTVNGVSSGTSILREWKYSDYTAGANGHRHSSHLMCLYPFSQVEEGSDLFQAAVNSLQLRGDASTGWSMAWKVNLWARAKNGAHAHQIFDYALIAGRGSGGVFYNLFDVHAPYYFQIDGNFGACAGMAEMLMQSHTGTIEILPALPASLWRNGHINGLKAVGDFTVDIAWKNAKADQVVIRSNQGQPLRVKYSGIGKAGVKFLISGREVTPTAVSDDLVEIPASAGDEVYIFFNGVPTAVAAVEAAPSPTLSFNGRRVSVGGDVARLALTDLQGRIVRTAKGNTIEAPRAAGDLFILTITQADGTTFSQKIGL
ncbi:MAG: glycoside hydrolase family 95 protein [Bacteroidaceae bacterium]|nr:glycoside hydrolase family 95 protein [Bacteroidaceae bacterium]